MTQIVILTGSELRHTYFRMWMALSDRYRVINTYCEGLEKSLETAIAAEGHKDLRIRHLAARKQSERDFFGAFVDKVADRSNPVFLPKGRINAPEYVQAIIDAKPDLIIAYGCSIIRDPLLEAFEGRFLNVHLGLSPYYRGSGTNYWPLVNAAPEYVGATIMYIDAGIDTGEIIHQIRARLVWGDTPSQIGNRLIVDMCQVYQRIVENFDRLTRVDQLPIPDDVKVYRKKDFSEISVQTLYANFASGLVEKHIQAASSRALAVPIIRNPGLEEIDCP